MKEEEIVQGCIKNNAEAQHALFRKYSGRLMTICLRYGSNRTEAEDMLQEAFISIFKHINQYESRGSFEGWLRKITVNAALQVLQKKRIRFTEITDTHHEFESQEFDILNQLEADDLLRLISYLPGGYRTVFNLYVIEGFSHEEIAKMLRINATTSRSQLSKARAVLKEKIISLNKIPG